MPLYEYVCPSCDLRFEKLTRSQDEHVICPACQGGEVEKQPSRFAFARTGAVSSSGGCGCGRSSCSCHH